MRGRTRNGDRPADKTAELLCPFAYGWQISCTLFGLEDKLKRGAGVGNRGLGQPTGAEYHSIYLNNLEEKNKGEERYVWFIEAL